MEHGGDLSDAIRRHGGARDAWLDLSTGINPRPWPMPTDLPGEVWHRLPARDDEDALIAAARAAYRVPEGTAIVPAPGTQALIQWLPRLAAPGAVAIVAPTYGEHAACWETSGREVITLAQLDQLPDSVRHAVVGNPNNPDGRVTARATLAQAAACLARREGWLVIDECFVDLDPTISATDLCDHLPIVVLRSFGKFYGLPGTRLGFAIAVPAIARRIAAALGPWAVSGPALAIGRVALSDVNWADKTRRELQGQAGLLDEVLAGAGLSIVGGTSLFRLVRHSRADELHANLAQQHIWSRRFAWASDLLRFGLPPDQAGLDRLAAALSAAK
jgi:cobalamin biosynthetic protein CobC